MNYFSHGKLLLTAEYLVLDGALALALPTKQGQTMAVEPFEDFKIKWIAKDYNNTTWFKTVFNFKNKNFEALEQDNQLSKKLSQIFKVINQLNPKHFTSNTGYAITTQLNFNKSWGFGTSSTLINNLAQWANIDAYQLLKKTFGGSGYDIACAQHSNPITYLLKNSKPIVKIIHFNPKFKEHLYFIYLNKKQNSRKAITNYNIQKPIQSTIINEVSSLTQNIIKSNSLSEFASLIKTHENIVSSVLKQPKIQDLHFKDFKGAIKSLGAWGGDFILATSKENPKKYFENKGFKTVLKFEDIFT